MEQVPPFSDPRLRQSCVFCGGAAGTRDHVPSQVLLDEPFPENLPVVEACAECNSGFAEDESYLACWIDVARAGVARPELVPRRKIARILTDQPKLRERLERARRFGADGLVSFEIEATRARNVLLKLARGHAAFELDERRRDEPITIWMARLQDLGAEAHRDFETPPVISLWPEVGSRAMQRMHVVSVYLRAIDDPTRVFEHQFLLGPDWMEVQPGRYRYLVAGLDAGQLVVRIVFSEEFACEVVWAGTTLT